MRTLVIDDSDEARYLTEAALLSAGFDNILTASSGWDALKILNIGGKNDAPADIDMLLLDIVMPEMDGIELCARIRNDERYADLPIIMLTAVDDVDALSNAFMAGANYYVGKPVNRVELVAHMRAARRLKNELDRRREREIDLLHFMSTWSERRATVWMDEATGLFVGEVAEAYLASAVRNESGQVMSILALTVDGLAAHRDTRGSEAANCVLARVAQTVQRLAATVGVIAAAYPDGTIVLVVPELDEPAVHRFAEMLRGEISKIQWVDPKSSAAVPVTASIAVLTGNVKKGVDGVHLLTRASAKSQEAAEAGGNRVLVSKV
ncbi:MAG: response regulator [Xanthobacteraceae bacterium]